MDKDELLGLLTDAEKEAARRMRARTTVQPIQQSLAPMQAIDDLEIPSAMPEHSPLPIGERGTTENPVLLRPRAVIVEDTTTPIGDDAQFAIDTRELDARVFQKQALDMSRSGSVRAIGSAQAVPLLQPTPEEPMPAPPVAKVDAADEATDLVLPLDLDMTPPRRGHARLFVWTTLISVAVTSSVLLALQFLK